MARARSITLLVALRWVVGAALAVMVPVGWLLWWGAWVGPQRGEVATLTEAHVFFSKGPELDTRTIPSQVTQVRLPHAWTPEQHMPGIWAHYDLDVPRRCDEGMTIAIPNHMPDLKAVSAGQVLQFQLLTGRWNQVLVAQLPPCDTSDGPPPVVRISVAERFAWQGGIGEVWAGPEAPVMHRAWVISGVRAIANHLVVGVLMSFAILAFFGWLLRPSPILAWVLAASLVAAIRQSLFSVFGTWDGDNHILALMIWSTLGSVCSASMVVLLMTRQRWLDLAVWIVAGAALLGCALYVPWGSVMERRWLGNMIVFPVLVLTVKRCAKTIWRDKDWVVMALLLTMGLQWLMFTRSMLTSGGRLPFEFLNNATLLSPAIAVIIGLAMAHRLQRAFFRYETLSQQLQTEVNVYKAELDERSQREQTLAVREAAEVERTRWMQEIHDGLGSLLIGTRFLTDKLPPQPGLPEVKSSVDEAIEQLRTLVESLSPVPASIPSLLGAMRYRITPKLEAAGLRVEWDVDLRTATDDVSPVAALNVQRIVQEALTNVLKHAHATELRVRICPEGNGTLVRLEDNGVGFEAEIVHRGRGLDNMSRRAAACAATVSWTRLDPGTRVDVFIENRLSNA